jgi:hypothetical protein
MAAKKQNTTPINLNPNWLVSEEYNHGRDLIIPGDRVKIKFERGDYKFIRHVFHTQKEVEWIDCVGAEGYRSFYVDVIKGKVKPKKFRRKRNAS